MLRLVAWPLVLCLLLLPMLVAAKDDPVVLRQLLSELDALRQASGISALGLSIVDADEVVWQGGLGFHSHSQQQPMTAQSLIRVGSITKGFTALALLHAQQRGLLSLDDPVRQYTGGRLLDNAWCESNPVTIAQLLEHTAGFADISKAEWDYNTPAQPLLATLTDYANRREVLWRPGLHSSYSNAGAGLAAYALEKVAGTSYENYLHNYILAPMGMKDSGFFIDQEQGKLVTGYDTDGSTPIPYWHMVYRPFGGLNSTVKDMTRYLQMLLGRGTVGGKRLFPASLIERMEVPRTSLAARRGLEYGYGLGSAQWLRGGVLLRGHSGDADGYLSRLGYSVAYKRGYFLVINAFNSRSLRHMQKIVEDYLIGDAPGLLPPPPIKLGNTSLQSLAGVYEEVTERFAKEGDPGKRGKKSLTIGLDGEALSVQFKAGQVFQLLPVARNQFRWADTNIATVSIAMDEDGSRYFQSDDGNFCQQTGVQ